VLVYLRVNKIRDSSRLLWTSVALRAQYPRGRTSSLGCLASFGPDLLTAGSCELGDCGQVSQDLRAKPDGLQGMLSLGRFAQVPSRAR
jgi:hypothetical protein